MKDYLLNKINTRTAKIGVVGMGYVGLPLAVEFAEASFDVIGVDIAEKKVDLLNNGKSYIPDIPTDRLAPLIASGKLTATTSYTDIADADAISICVPTPLRKTKDPDMSYIMQSAEAIAPICHEGMLIVLESTTYPGTTREVIVPMLLQNGFEIGRNIFVAYSPERIDPGNKIYTVHNTPKVVGGVTEHCNDVMAALYGTIIETIIPVSSPTSAEMVKLLENTFRAVNIGLVNEMALICDRLGIDVWEVIEAAASKSFGFMPFYPGPGLGGHCIPVDPHYLSWKLKTLNYTARFIELASEINTAMPLYVVEKVNDALNNDCKPVRGSSILVLGVAYKRDIDDVRESPALDVINLLTNKGANVMYHDPFVPNLQLPDGSQLATQPYSIDLLSQMDAVVITTDHSAYDWQEIVDHSPLIVDTRNATAGLSGTARIVSL
ncbi:MAG: nucleotide sugar dehydrogenase [Chloroflexi bacterium]|nr:nucleotide sugar dehydrogenase [Chloroflexota bacterium]